MADATAARALRSRVAVRRATTRFDPIRAALLVRSSASAAGSRARRAGAWVLDNEATAVRLGLVCIVAVLGLALVLFRGFLLPAKFLYDGDTIHRLALSGAPGWDVDESFANVAAVYRILGLQDNEVAASLLGYGFALFVIGFAMWRRRFAANVPGTIAVVLSVLFSAVYLGAYSKDVFVLPIVLLAMQARGGWRREVLLLAALLVYADVFRTYWFLVAGFYLAYRLVDRLARPRWVLLVAPAVALALVAVAFPVALGVDSDFARAQSNQWRIDSPDAATMIGRFVALPGSLGSGVNTLLVLLSIFVPVPLLLRGGLYYAAIALCFVALWATFFVGLGRLRRLAEWMRPVALLLAFLTVQALFEPDYGSLLRHLTPLMPLICLVALAPGARRAHAFVDVEQRSAT